MNAHITVYAMAMTAEEPYAGARPKGLVRWRRRMPREPLTNRPVSNPQSESGPVCPGGATDLSRVHRANSVGGSDDRTMRHPGHPHMMSSGKYQRTGG
jgi:hypothetical protein